MEAVTPVAEIDRTITVEDLVTTYPGAVGLLIRRGLPCLVCGEPVWGTLEEFAREHGRGDDEIAQLVFEINNEVKKEHVS